MAQTARSIVRGGRTRSQTVRGRLRARCAELGLTQQQVADRAGWSQRKVSNVLNGSRAPKIDELAQWAEALDTTELYLLGFTFDSRKDAGTLTVDTPGYTKRRPRRTSLLSPERAQLVVVPPLAE